jgi:hypothetical protein
VIPNDNSTFLYFVYNHSTKSVEIEGTHIIPEFPSLIIPLLLMTTTLLAAVMYKKKKKTQNESVFAFPKPIV